MVFVYKIAFFLLFSVYLPVFIENNHIPSQSSVYTSTQAKSLKSHPVNQAWIILAACIWSLLN